MTPADEVRYEEILRRRGFSKIDNDVVLRAIRTALEFMRKSTPAYIQIADEIITVAISTKRGVDSLWRYDGLIELPDEFTQLKTGEDAPKHRLH